MIRLLVLMLVLCVIAPALLARGGQMTMRERGSEVGALALMCGGIWLGFAFDVAWFGVGAGAMVLSIGAFVGLMSRAPAAPLLAGRDEFWGDE